MNPELGIVRGESIEVYHAEDCTSHSKLEVLRDLDRGPARYFRTYVTREIPPFEGNAATDIGQAFDSLLLEGETIYVQQPATYYGPESQKKDAPLVEKPWNNNAKICQEWHAEQGGKIVLNRSEIALLATMRTAVEQHPDASALLLHGEAQVTFRMPFRKFAAQVRPDKWHADSVELSTGRTDGPVIADLKTAEDLSRFEQNRRALGYDRQAALYREVVREVLARHYGVPLAEVPKPDFFFVVVFKSAPVDCAVFRLSDEDLSEATAEVIGDLQLLQRCYDSGEWPGSPRGIQVMPKLWRKRQEIFA